jgi:hypothetical protein
LRQGLRRERLYAGDIFIFSETVNSRPHQPCPGDAGARLRPARPALCSRTHDIGRGGGGPRQAEATVHHPECKKLISAIMREYGIDLDKLYFDVLRMRGLS